MPQCALAIGSVFREAGFPRDVFKVLLMDSNTAMKVIDYGKVDGVSLTGSSAAGEKIAEIAGRNLKKVVLELGGSDPYIVLDDADIKLACELGTKSRLLNAGQCCTSAKRFIVTKKRAKDFEKEFLSCVGGAKVGDPLKKETNIGPLSSKR